MTREELLHVVRTNKRMVSNPMFEYVFDPLMAHIYAQIEKKMLSELSSNKAASGK